jgi:hypothetical protein
VAFLLLEGLLVISASPNGQGGYQAYGPSGSSSSSSGSASASRPSAPYVLESSYGTNFQQPQEPQGSAATFGSSFASAQTQQQQGFGAFGGGGGGSSGGSGSGPTAECQRQEVSPGRFKFVCGGVNPEAISLKREHILWLSGGAGQSQVVDIEVPNYKIQELIKAGFKTGGVSENVINVLLKRPETSVDAQIDQLNTAQGVPKVQIQYEAVDKKLVHFPNDQAYSPLQGPILPPLQDGRFQRQAPQIHQQQQQQYSRPQYVNNKNNGFAPVQQQQQRPRY